MGALGRMLAERLDACFLEQVYSRLVVDCNRAPERADAVPAVSDGTVVPGNAGLSATDRAARVAAIHAPYQAAIAEAFAGRRVLIALHSFTPVMGGVARPWDVGVLHDGGDSRFALALLERLRGEGDLVVGDNEPYRMDATDYSVPLHAYAAGRGYAEIEIRQDRLAQAEGQAMWARRLARVLADALGGGD